MCDATGVGLFVRAEATPDTGQIDAWAALFFPEGDLATVLLRGTWPQPADGLRVGRLALHAAEALTSWTIECADTALVFPSGPTGLRGKGERTGAATRVAIDARFDATMPPSGLIDRATDVNEDGFVRTVSAGHFEQAVALSGRLRAGTRSLELSGSGVRERAWGAGQAGPGVWIAAAFDDGFAICARVSSPGVKIRSGWIHDGGVTRALATVHVETDLDGSAPIALRAQINDDAGNAHEVHGEVVTAMPGREPGGRARRCLMRFTVGARQAYGFAEFIDV